VCGQKQVHQAIVLSENYINAIRMQISHATLNISNSKMQVRNPLLPKRREEIVTTYNWKHYLSIDGYNMPFWISSSVMYEARLYKLTRVSNLQGKQTSSQVISSETFKKYQLNIKDTCRPSKGMHYVSFS
jgi:hypothetical protein